MTEIDDLAQRLTTELSGMLSRPGEAAYEQAVNIWAKPRARPALVAHCLDENDVRAAVVAAREAEVDLSVRGGGHDLAGRSLCPGLTLDMTAMNSVGPISRDGTIEIGGGAKGNDVYATTDPAGVAPVLGAVADVGIAGLMMGGGYGTLLRRFGMACDNLRAATVVLADGSIVRASEEDDAELFWAICGGGGNFGVITSMELAVYPMGAVRSGLMLFPFDHAEHVLTRLGEIWADAPVELDVQIGIVSGPDGSPVIYVSPTWSGDPSAADDALAPLNALKGCFMNNVRDQPYGESRRFYDDRIVNGLAVSANTAWLREWNAGVVSIIIDAVRRRPSPACVVLCHEFSGAAAQVPSSHTAFALREPHFWFEVIAPRDPQSDSAGTAEADWVHGVIDSLGVHSFPGGYPNMLEPGNGHRAEIGYGANVARLLRAKRRYDPHGVFSSATELSGDTDRIGASTDAR